MGRLAGIASMTSSSDKNCSSKSIDLLSQTGLDTLVRPVPHAKKEKTITYHLRPTDLMRLIHSRNRRKFGKIFGANKADLKAFWTSSFSTKEGQEFKELHPTLRLQQPEHLKASIPIVVHEDTERYRINIAHSFWLAQLHQPFLFFCSTSLLGFSMAKGLDQTAFH